MFTELHLHHFRVKCTQYSSISVRYSLHRLTATYFRCTSVIAGFRRHLVGKTLINVRYRDTDKLMII